jgi:hypothetical protein
VCSTCWLVAATRCVLWIANCRVFLVKAQSFRNNKLSVQDPFNPPFVPSHYITCRALLITYAITLRCLTVYSPVDKSHLRHSWCSGFNTSFWYRSYYAQRQVKKEHINPWTKLRFGFSRFDGSGVRGLSSLYILKDLMRQIPREHVMNWERAIYPDYPVNNTETKPLHDPKGKWGVITVD